VAALTENAADIVFEVYEDKRYARGVKLISFAENGSVMPTEELKNADFQSTED
jgi:hypothetical protein